MLGAVSTYVDQEEREISEDFLDRAGHQICYDVGGKIRDTHSLCNERKESNLRPRLRAKKKSTKTKKKRLIGIKYKKQTKP